MSPSPSSSLSSQWWLCGSRRHCRRYHCGGGRVAVAVVLVVSNLSSAVLVTTRLRGFSGGLMKDRRVKMGHNKSWLDFVAHLLAFHSLSGPLLLLPHSASLLVQPCMLDSYMISRQLSMAMIHQARQLSTFSIKE
jgi:hypothetical protein